MSSNSTAASRSGSDIWVERFCSLVAMCESTFDAPKVHHDLRRFYDDLILRLPTSPQRDSLIDLRGRLLTKSGHLPDPEVIAGNLVALNAWLTFCLCTPDSAPN